MGVVLNPGEHVDFVFAGGAAEPGTRLVLTSRGWYESRPVSDGPLASLAQNHPNPFNPRTRIDFRTESVGRAELRIYDVAGRLVRTLVETTMPAGDHSVEWDGTNDRGSSVGSGVFFYELRAGTFHEQRRMVLLR